MEDSHTESENAKRVIQDFVFLCRKIGSINGYFLQVYNNKNYIVGRVLYLQTL